MIAAAVRSPGGLLAALGGLLVALAYLTMPLASLPLIGQITAPSLVSELSGQDAPSLTLLRLVPVIALLIIALGLWSSLASPPVRARRVGAVAVVACAGLTGIAYLIPYNTLDQELSQFPLSWLGIDAATFTGAGFWCALLGALVAALGGLVQLVTGRAVAPST